VRCAIVNNAFALWRCHAACRFVKLLAIVRAPPIVHVAALVAFRSEGIETMGQFVCGQYANPVEIDRRVRGTVEERRLNEAGGDVQAIHRSDIAGLRRRGCHVPFVGFERLETPTVGGALGVSA
jgi:hypothetical protein